MTKTSRTARPLTVAAGLVAAMVWMPAFGADAVDAAAAEALARQNNCFKCHAIEKKKDGPAYKEVAAKYKGKPDAEARLFTHLTTGEKAKFPDGHEEEHKIVKAKDPNDVKNLIRWLLAQ